MMNKATLLLIAFSVMLVSVSCEGFLDRQPLDQLTDGNFYQTEADANRAILSVYTPMMDVEWTGKGWMITEFPSDNSQAGGLDPDFTPIDNFTVAPDNGPVANYWAIHFRQVVLANVAIEKIGGMTIDEATKTEFMAEARFLRALAYFDLVRIYGGVPLGLEAPKYGDDLMLPRSSVDEVYELIASDFEFAAEHLPLQWAGTNVGRATRGAALAYLAKVSLTTREFVKARDYASDVMDLGVYELMENYGDNFELNTSDNNKESIFQVQYTGCSTFGTGNANQAFFAPWGEGITKDRDGWGSQIPTGPQLSNPGTTIFDAFEEGDLRKNPTIMSANVFYPTINPSDGGYTYPAAGASATAINIKKYVVGSGPNICFMSTPQNSHLVRYSDVLLSYGEAIMEIEGGISSNGEALGAVNAVRVRAGLDPLTELTRDVILAERRVEFAFEGQRWYDLLRSGRAVEILSLHGKKPNADKLLFPIPDSEMKINPNLVQNPGY